MIVGCSVFANGDHLHEVRIQTGNDGMAAFFGQLSVKVCCICWQFLSKRNFEQG